MTVHYLIAYDTSCKSTRDKLHSCVSAFSVNQQKSAYICALKQTERHKIKKQLLQITENSKVHVALIFIAVNKKTAVCMGEANLWLVPVYMLGYDS